MMNNHFPTTISPLRKTPDRNASAKNGPYKAQEASISTLNMQPQWSAAKQSRKNTRESNRSGFKEEPFLKLTDQLKESERQVFQ